MVTWDLTSRCINFTNYDDMHSLSQNLNFTTIDGVAHYLVALSRGALLLQQLITWRTISRCLYSSMSDNVAHYVAMSLFRDL